MLSSENLDFSNSGRVDLPESNINCPYLFNISITDFDKFLSVNETNIIFRLRRVGVDISF